MSPYRKNDVQGDDHFDVQSEDRLCKLARLFRSTRDIAKRTDIAEEYARTVHQLIEKGGWTEVPVPEDQLPRKWMPNEFFEYWFGEHDALSS